LLILDWKEGEVKNPIYQQYEKDARENKLI